MLSFVVCLGDWHGVCALIDNVLVLYNRSSGHAPGCWELNHTAAEIALVQKAGEHNADLTDAERAQLLSISEQPYGKALSMPSSLSEEVRRCVMGWPPDGSCCRNLAAVGLGHLGPDQVMAKAHPDPKWLTSEQAHLVMHRFNACSLEEDTESTVPTDRETAASSGANPGGGRGIPQCQVSLSTPRHVPTAVRRRPVKAPAMEYPKWVHDIVREKRTYGFTIYRTTEIEAKRLEYIETQTVRRGKPPKHKSLKSFSRLWTQFLASTIWGLFGEIEQMHDAITGHRHHIARPFMDLTTGEFDASATEEAAFREHFRTSRAEGKLRPGLHKRYFLLIDEDGFPSVRNVVFHNMAPFPEVWVYDPDWNPPEDGDGIRDADGYQGRLKVRYAYHTYVYSYPLTLEEGYDLKRLWLELPNKRMAYPFPGSDIGALEEPTIIRGPSSGNTNAPRRANRGPGIIASVFGLFLLLCAHSLLSLVVDCFV
ncbi:hypothetical protein BX600DRAFT_442830 [Xylariales sp. PMI_506]|nr:hypothetical protein BX600DRAFT_442830 [Xylariales sp. PMI_506]